MLFVLRIILYVLSLPPILLAVCLVLSTQNDKPADFSAWRLSSEDIQKAKSIIYANQAAAGERVHLNLSERDLNLAGTYVLNLYIDTRVAIQLTDDFIDFKLAFSLPENLLGRYMLMQFQLHLPAHQAPFLKNLRIGELVIADGYAEFLIDSLIKYTHLNEYVTFFRQNLKHLSLHKQTLHIEYALPNNSLGALQKILAPKIDERALAQYQARLKQILIAHNPKWLLSLSELLQGLFELAHQRSTINNAVAENKLVIFIVNQYVNKGKQAILKQGLPYYAVYMYKRMDLVQHFMWSAMLASSGSGQAAYMLGLEKELSDAERGSGFSFVDLAADKAGIYFAEYAILNGEQAFALQMKMANIKHYSAFMPSIKNLPEHLNTKAFKQKYHSIYDVKYQYTLKKIDERIAKSSLYH